MATKRKSNKKKDVKVYLIVLWTLFVMFGLSVFLLFHGIVHEWFGEMPTFEELENPETNLATEIISADGKILGTYYIENRSNVSYEDISPDLIHALIAIEDVRFYEHSGIDKRALFRVAKGLMTGNSDQGGGSTITQQLAKNLFPRGENLSKVKLVIRKLQEWVTATKLEYNYSKDEIIAMYLNTVFTDITPLVSRRRRRRFSARSLTNSRSKRLRCWRASSTHRRSSARNVTLTTP